MRVAEITAEPIVHGGQERFILNLLKHITARDIEIDVVAPYFCNNKNFEETLTARGGKLIKLGLDFAPGKSRKNLLKPVSNVLREGGYDVAHIHSGSISALAYCALAAHRAGCRQILVHSHCTGILSLKHSMIRIAFAPLLKLFPTNWLACSRKAGEDKFPRSIVNKKLIVIKNGIELEQFQRDNELGQKVRKELGIARDAFVIGHVGHFSPQKNHSFLIDVFAEVHARKPESCLVLVGEGALKKMIADRVDALGLKHCVYFIGVTDNVSSYYNAMDCFAFPSLFEGLSYVLVEAQANGLPCLMSEGLTDEAVFNSNIIKLSLQKELWIEKLLKAESFDRIEDQNAIVKAGFSARETAKTVETLYRAR